MMKTLNEYIRIYTENAKTHSEATESGEYKLANKCYDEVISALEEILRFGDAGREEVLKLLQNDDIGVQCSAATHSLKYDEEQALAVLNKISHSNGIVSLRAEMVITQWKKGNLK